MTYFQTKSWALNDGSTVLDLDQFDDEMFYYVALESKYIANSERELREHKWPQATHYISIDGEVEEMQYERNKRKLDAFQALGSKTMTLPRKREFMWILKLADTRNSLEEETIENTLYRYIDQDNNQEGGNIDKFMELYNLAKSDKGRAEVKARLLLQQALDTRVIYEKAETYSWPRPKGTIILGERYSDAVEFILNPKKDSLVEELESEIQAKR